jgi:hypothetical protein
VLYKKHSRILLFLFQIDSAPHCVPEILVIRARKPEVLTHFNNLAE